MPPTDYGAMDSLPNVPSMLDLLRISPRRLFPSGSAELCHQIGLLTGMSEGLEVLDVACGLGFSLEHLVKKFGVQGFGVDIAPDLVEQSTKRARNEGIASRVQFQTGPSSALPYRDEIFDVTIGEIGLANHCEPREAIAELVRVTKPNGFVVLVQLVWKAPVYEPERSVLGDYLGATPMMSVEWKRLLKESGIRNLHVEDWSNNQTIFRSAPIEAFPDLTKTFSFSEKVAILRQTWRRWGWKGVKTGILKGREVHHLLAKERVLGLELLKGRKVAEPIRLKSETVVPVETPLALSLDDEKKDSDSPKEAVIKDAPALELAPSEDYDSVIVDDERSDTSGLPLFSPEEE